MKSLAPSPAYVSNRQLSIEGFETPFHRNLDPENRWVTLAGQMPWDELSQLLFCHTVAHNWKSWVKRGKKFLNPCLLGI